MKFAINLVLSILCFACLIFCATCRADTNVPSVRGGTLLKFDFTDTQSWPDKDVVSSAIGKTAAALTAARVGTVDVAGSAQPSGGLLFSARNAKGVGSAAFVSGKLPLRCRETNPNKLTLSFSLSASSTRPVTVRVESFDKAKRRTGSREAQIFPAAPDFYQRYALDLSQMTTAGVGRFRATDPFVQFTFAVRPQPGVGTPGSVYTLRLDNVNYAAPAYYVSPKGSDANDGRTEATAFASPQKALDVSRPGDIIDVMNGTYISPNGPSAKPFASGGLSPVANFTHPGAPDAWIVLKNYPGQHPTFFSNGWTIVSMGLGSNEKHDTGPALAYLEIRGLHVRGEGDVVRKKYPDSIRKSDSRSNSNGINVDSRYSALAHHIRIADNIVEHVPGQGIGGGADCLTIENNVCDSNSWTTIYALSGISVASSTSFDAQANVYKQLIRNNICCHNQDYEMWVDVGRYSDGNGIILDVNQGQDPNQPFNPNASNYIGRTLVQSNLCYDNGGSGIHTVQAYHVDIINNTVYLNSASVHLEYSEMFTYGSSDVHFINNIMVAPVANVAVGEKPEPVNAGAGTNTNVTFSHNVYFGGNIAPTLGEGDVIADPQFLNATIDTAKADFHLKPGSPAIGKGVVMPFSPLLDLDGKRRQSRPSKGAYEK